jgi:glycosyltransferase involved in cell wall biosynthesis
MRCPDLTELPPPPSDKDGWPWTRESASALSTLPDGKPWPLITIVTPSYNQGPFLEATIRSVLLQGYPNLEYIVIDGGSTDESVDILRKYEPWLAYWVSERDRGQSDAINKGFTRATGEIYGWLNSDDVYARDALKQVGHYFATVTECEFLYGDGYYMDEAGNKTHSCDWIRPFDHALYLTSNFILQPTAFWRRVLWEKTGGLDISYHWAMDWEWFIRATALTRPHYLPTSLAGWRIRPEIKTRSGGAARRAEIAEISRRYGGFWQPTHLVYQLDRFAWWATSRLGDGPLARLSNILSAPIRWFIKNKLWDGRYQN